MNFITISSTPLTTLGIVLTVLKYYGLITTSWWICLMPFYGLIVIGLIIFLISTFMGILLEIVNN